MFSVYIYHFTFSFLEMLGTSQYNTPGLKNILADYQENEYIDLHPKVNIILMC